MSTILVPLDGSPLAEQALPHACRLALMADAGLLLVRAAAPVVDPDTGVASRSSVQHAEAYLHAVRERLRTDGFTVEIASLFSNPVPGILRVARTHAVTAIVMSTHGRTGLRRMVLGSVTEQVVQESNVPVLVISGDSPSIAKVDRYQQILVPLDGSGFAEAALATFKKLRINAGAEIVLLRSVQPPSSAPQDQRLTHDLEQRRDEARNYLERVATSVLNGRTYRVLAPVGRPAEAILTAVADHEIDLIVIATHTRHGRIRFSPTSVAGQVLQNSGTPVLVVRGVDDADDTAESTLPDVEQSESEEDNIFDDFLFV